MIDGKSILITGGTGSFGQTFTQYVLNHYIPRRLIIFSRDEFKQAEMQTEYSRNEYSCLRYFIGNVRDLDRLRWAFRDVDYIIHAAALKRVSECEYNPHEAVKTNIGGTQNVIYAALECRCEKAIYISSDKACLPANLYGATKLVAEKLFVHGNIYAGRVGTKFSCVRLGNIIGSRGSVLPLFRKQQRQGTLMITDPEATRFWIMPSEAVQFTLTCLAEMQGGEVFIPKMPSAKVVDLAEAVAPGADHKVVGLSVGERLHETLVSTGEARLAREYDKYFVILPKPVDGKTNRYSSDEVRYRLTVKEIGVMVERL